MSKLKIGWASRDVSSDKPLNIPGQFHMRISQGVMDPVTVTALVVDSGEDYIIFLSADLVVIRSHLLDDIRASVSVKNSQIDPIKILMNATHAHTGPSHYSDTGWYEEGNGSVTSSICDVPHDGIEIASGEEYRAFLADMASDAICEAWETRSEAGVAYGYGYAVVAHSRRVVYFDDVSTRPENQDVNGYMINGHGVMYGNTADPNFSGYETGTDHFINLMYTFSGGKLTGAIINVPCPSQNSESLTVLTADYWHDVRVKLRELYGDIYILPQCAAAGDLAPRVMHYKKAQSRRYRLKYGTDENVELLNRREIAQRITEAFGEVLSWAQNDIKYDLPVVHRVETAMLSKRPISPDELADCKKALERLEAIPFTTQGLPMEQLFVNSSLEAERNRLRQAVKRAADYDNSPKLPMELHVAKIGDISFASNRFELYMDYMHRIQARSPFEQTFIIQLAGVPGSDGGSYLATERAAANRGYSACLFCNLVSPQGGQELVEDTLRILNEIY